MGQALRNGRCRTVAAMVVGLAASAPGASSAENFFDVLFGGLKPQQASPPAQQAPETQAQPVPQPQRSASGYGPAFCVRSCDGRYFPLARGTASPAQLCQAFCPASPTKVFFGSRIDHARTAGGERYADSENAYAYRTALRSDCSCNGRGAAGLATVDPALDQLRAGDLVATADGIVAYSGIRLGVDQAPDFTPVADYPGLTEDTRNRLNGIRVAAPADVAAAQSPAPGR